MKYIFFLFYLQSVNRNIVLADIMIYESNMNYERKSILALKCKIIAGRETIKWYMEYMGYKRVKLIEKYINYLRSQLLLVKISLLEGIHISEEE